MNINGKKKLIFGIGSLTIFVVAAVYLLAGKMPASEPRKNLELDFDTPIVDEHVDNGEVVSAQLNEEPDEDTSILTLGFGLDLDSQVLEDGTEASNLEADQNSTDELANAEVEDLSVDLDTQVEQIVTEDIVARFDVDIQLVEPIQGITAPAKNSTVSATVSGRLTTLRVKEGASVKAGDIILELEHGQESLELARRKLISDSKVEVDYAKARMETLRLDLDATKKLFETSGSVSREEMLEKELEYKMVYSEHQGLLLAEKREEIEYKIAREELNKRIIRAPFDAIVAKLYLEEGENCNPQEPLVNVVNTRQCRFTGYVNPQLGGQFLPGMVVNVSVENSEQIYQGVVEHISPVIDPSSGLQEFKVIFDNTGNTVCPGVNAEVSLVLNAN